MRRRFRQGCRTQAGPAAEEGRARVIAATLSERESPTAPETSHPEPNPQPSRHVDRVRAFLEADQRERSSHRQELLRD